MLTGSSPVVAGEGAAIPGNEFRGTGAHTSTHTLLFIGAQQEHTNTHTHKDNAHTHIYTHIRTHFVASVSRNTHKYKHIPTNTNTHTHKHTHYKRRARWYMKTQVAFPIAP